MRKMKHTGEDSFIYTDKFVVFGYEYEYRYTVTGLGRSLTNPKLVIELLRGGKKLAPKQTIDVNVDHMEKVMKTLFRKHNKLRKESAEKHYQQWKEEQACANNSTSSSTTTGQ